MQKQNQNQKKNAKQMHQPTIQRIPNFFKSIQAQQKQTHQPTLMPANNNTHLVLIQTAYYSQLIHFSIDGKKLKSYYSQGKIKYYRLNQNTIVIMTSILKYNGEYRDIIVCWDLNNGKQVQINYRAEDDDDDDIGYIDVQLLLFQQTNMICLLQTHIHRKTHNPYQIILNYYQYIPNAPIKYMHRYRYKYSQILQNKQCQPIKINNSSLIGFISLRYPVQIQHKLTQQKQIGQNGQQSSKQIQVSINIQCYNYDIDKNIGQSIVLQCICSIQPDINDYNIILDQIWTIDKSKQLYYIKLHANHNKINTTKQTNNKQQQILYEYIWNKNNNKSYKIREHSCDMILYYNKLYNRKFNVIHYPMHNNKKLLRDDDQGLKVNVIYVINQSQYLAQQIELTQKINENNCLHCEANKIIWYILQNNQLVIKQIKVKQFPYSNAQIGVFFSNCMIQNSEEDLLMEIFNLLI